MKRQRKPLRLQGYDYKKPGYYFVTACARQRGENVFASISLQEETVGAIMNRPLVQISLTRPGQAVRQAIFGIPAHYRNVAVDTYVIMPDHVHMILAIRASGDGRLIAAPTAVGLSVVMQQFKRTVSKAIGVPLWQRGYYDHIIRQEEDLRAFRQYILENPLNWKSNKE